MRKIIQILAITLILSVINVPAQSAVRVKFKRGAISATVTGNLNGYKSKKVYVIRVRAGQTLKVEQVMNENSTHYLTLAIKNPSGEDVTDSDASCNNRKEVTPTEDGDYTITVAECMKADAWRGKFYLKFTAE